jgi:hypothetical protein
MAAESELALFWGLELALVPIASVPIPRTYEGLPQVFFSTPAALLSAQQGQRRPS